jgi:hypothetical protein
MPSAPSFNRIRRCQTQGLYDGGQPTSITVLPAKQDQFCPIILSIKNEYIDWIESGAKTNEYRKRLPADAFSHVVFFNTDTRRIQGFAVVNEVWVGPPQMIADQTWPKSGTDAAGLIEYFGVNRPFGFAILMAGYQNFASRFGDSVASKLSLSSVHELEPTFAAPPSYDFLEKYPQLEMRLHDLMVAQ